MVMKYLIFLFLVFVSGYSLSQLLTSDNFDPSKLNAALLKEFNNYRRSKGLDTLVYSQTCFDSLSYPNCVEVASSGKFYHPYINDKWKRQELREMIVKDSKSSVGGSVVRHSSGLPWLDTYENAFRSYGKYYSYESLAKMAIESWELSPAHNRVQNLDFTSSGLPGLFSCHSEFGVNGYVYIYINFIRVHRI